jgi:hypothetical protein
LSFAPFTKRQDEEHGRHNQQGSDDQPLQKPAALIWVNVEDDFDPIIPHECDYKQNTGQCFNQGVTSFGWNAYADAFGIILLLSFVPEFFGKTYLTKKAGRDQYSVHAFERQE